MIIKGSKDNYERLELIGQGNTGKVYQGRTVSSNKIVAIKQLASNLVENEMALQRYRQEAVLLSILDHPNIVKLIDVSEGAGSFTLVLEYFEGNTLEAFLAKFSGDREQLAEKIMGQLLEGLQNAHENGIFHRDIKPGNILINNKKEIKIIDFGIAKMIDSDENLAKTIIDTNIGTPRYMSPEQVKGLNLDHRTDLYSCGVLLYEILSGKVPYGDVKTMFAMQKKIIDDTIPHVQTSHSKWNSILEKALKKDRRDRYVTASDFRDVVLENTVKAQPILFQIKNASPGYQVAILQREEDPFKKVEIDADRWYPLDFDGCEESGQEVDTPDPGSKKNYTTLLVALICAFALLSVYFYTQEQKANERIIELENTILNSDEGAN